MIPQFVLVEMPEAVPPTGVRHRYLAVDMAQEPPRVVAEPPWKRPLGDMVTALNAQEAGAPLVHRIDEESSP